MRTPHPSASSRPGRLLSPGVCKLVMLGYRGEMDIASVFGTEGCGFESHRWRTNKIFVRHSARRAL
jgi:hypothetical protein